MNDKPIYSAIFTPHIKGTLDRDISDQHVTLSFGPSEEKLYEILQHSDKPIKIEIVGYGNDGKNEGLLVKILDDDIPYFGAEKVHITLSVSEDSTPVKTGDLAFDKEIPDHIPKIIYGTIGTFTAQKGVVFDKTYVENNCFDEIEKLVNPPEEKTINVTEDKEIDNNVIIDFEFNGLSRYGFTPEIIQMKAYNCANGKSVTMNFESENPITTDASLAMGGITELENTNGFFNKEKFVEALNSIGADLDSDFVGFSVSTDRRLLWNYDIHINYAIDLQDNLRLSKYEEDLALHGCSMEVCHKLVLGEFPEASHSDESELKALIDLYEADKELFHSKTLSVYPFGENAGMPLEIYCDVERRRADGYRYNNGGLLADSLDTWVGMVERYEYEDDLFYSAYCNDEFFNTGYFTIDETGILEFTDDESFYKCMQSDFCKFALTEIFEINNLDEFDFEQEYEYEYDEYDEYDEEDIDYEERYGYLPDENGFIISEDGVLLQYVGKEKDVVIPDSVKELGKYAFENCSSLTSVIIPDGVIHIGDNAFKNCTSLASVTVPDSVNWIGDSAFENCTSLTSITIPDSVKCICEKAFKDCNSLTSIIIPDSVMSISNEAFENCTSLKNVVIPDSVMYICNGAFHNCTSLTNIIIPPDSVTEIGKYAFDGCTALTSITIPDGMTSIGDYAFSGCSSLTSVTIPDSVTSIGDDTFSHCDSLTSINITNLAAWCNIDFESSVDNPLYSAENLYLNGKLVTDLIIPNGVTEIKSGTFYNCTSLTSVTIPDGVTSIGGSAFNYCENLKSITIPDSVTSIGWDAFENCKSLTNITIGNGVKSIGDSAFYNCKSLTSIIIPDGVKSIGSSAFGGCNALRSIIVPNEEMKEYLIESNNLPEGCEIKVASKELEQSQENKNEYYLKQYGGIPDEKGFIIKDGVLLNYIGKDENVIVPDGVTRIDAFAFSRCDFIKTVTLPDTVISIGEDAFVNCTSLESIKLSKNLEIIENRAFHNCSSLSSIDLPDSLTALGSDIFDECYSLANISIGNNLSSIGHSVFKHTEYYNNRNNWENGSLYIGNYLIDVDTSLTGEYIVKEGTKSLAPSAFQSCQFSDVVLPNSLNYIENLAFCNCSCLEKMTMPESVTHIGHGAFSGCTSLTSVSIGKNVIEIGGEAFYWCSSLKEITIPKNVELIGWEAFRGCESLESVTFEGNPKLIRDVFPDCKNIKTMIVRNEEMKQHLYETNNVPKGCEIKVVSKELEQSQDDEITNIEIGTDIPTNEDIGNVCKEIMDSKEEFVYDEVPDDKLVTSK